MGRLKANYNSSKNNKISIKKQNLGGGRLLLNYIFDPKEIQGLLAWLDASNGIATGGQPQFINQIVITASPSGSVNGTYTRSSGGHTQFDKSGGGTPITWNNTNGYWVIGALYYSVYLNYWYNDLGDNFEAAITYSNLPNIGVSTWTGQSSSGGITLGNYYAKPPEFTTLLPPQYISSAINSKPAIRFSGSAFYDLNSMFGSLGVSLNYESSVFIVMSSADIYSGTIFSTGTEAFYIAKNGSNLVVGSETWDSFSVNVGLQTNTKTLITCVNNQNNITIYSNGVSYGTTFFLDYPSGGGSIILGSASNQYDNASGFVGDIAEVIVYDRPLTDSERKKVEAYLKGKYAITCGYRNTNKLVQTAGNNAPIGANFDNIAFNYSSFASNCSALGLDPATILNDLGGVDFSSNYVVIRAKTTSSINPDSISALGDGIISITNSGFVSPAGNNYYRFFVMCKDGWNTVRFYGVNYPI